LTVAPSAPKASPERGDDGLAPADRHGRAADGDRRFAGVVVVLVGGAMVVVVDGAMVVVVGAGSVPGGGLCTSMSVGARRHRSSAVLMSATLPTHPGVRRNLRDTEGKRRVGAARKLVVRRAVVVVDPDVDRDRQFTKGTPSPTDVIDSSSFLFSAMFPVCG
jgi:hypothetical protein